MQGQHNQLGSNVKQAQQDKEIIELAALTHDLLESAIGRKWIKAAQEYYLVKQGSFHPGITNCEYWAAYREGQNSFIRQLDSWYREKKISDQLKAAQANQEAVTPNPAVGG